MKKYFLNVLLTILTVFTLSTSAMAFSTWGVDLNGDAPGGLISGINKFTYVATSLVNSTTSAGEDGYFNQLTAVKITDVNTADGASLDSGININHQITMEFTGAGSYVYDVGLKLNRINYASGTLRVYLDSALDYGTATPTALYGTNNGTLLGTFALDNGTGTMDFYDTSLNGTDGRINLVFHATQLLADTWYYGGTVLNVADYITLAILDSNNNLLSNSDVTPNQLEEFDETGLSTVLPATGYKNFFASSDGSFRLLATPVPEPATLMLFGMGLIGLGYTGRKKMMTM